MNANKLDNLDEIDKFQEIQNLPRLSLKEIENLNRPVTSKEIESIVTTLPTKKSLGPRSFTGELNQTFEELKRDFSSLQVNLLDCHSLTDAGKSHKTSGSMTQKICLLIVQQVV